MEQCGKSYGKCQAEFTNTLILATFLDTIPDLQNRCSTTELNWRNAAKPAVFGLISHLFSLVPAVASSSNQNHLEPILANRWQIVWLLSKLGWFVLDAAVPKNQSQNVKCTVLNDRTHDFARR